MGISNKQDIISALKALVASGVTFEDLAEFCGVHKSSVASWFTGERKLIGKSRLALLTLFRHRGIDCADQLKCRAAVIEAGEILTLRLSPEGEMVSELGLPNTDTLISYLGGKENPSEERYKNFEAFVDLRREGLKSAIANNPLLRAPQNGPIASVAISTQSEGMSKSEIIRIFVNAVQIAALAGNKLISDQFSKEERRAIREKILGERFLNNGLHDFADIISALLSEATRLSLLGDKR
jgi:transcriptional regulator with XRE-family HTH domain